MPAPEFTLTVALTPGATVDDYTATVTRGPRVVCTVRRADSMLARAAALHAAGIRWRRKPDGWTHTSAASGACAPVHLVEVFDLPRSQPLRRGPARGFRDK